MLSSSSRISPNAARMPRLQRLRCSTDKAIQGGFLMPKFAANLSMLFTGAPFLDRFALAAKAGFEGVEYLFPYDFDRAALRAALDLNGLTQVLHNLPAGDWAGGERGIAILPDR